MDRFWGVVIGGGVIAVLAVTTVECVRICRETLALERRRRSAGPVERPGSSRPVDVPGPAVDDLGEWVDYLDDDIAAAARRAIAEIAGE